MRSLITGSTGFIGSALTRFLRNSGDEVVTLSRASGDPDITDREAMLQVITDAKPEVVYHLAAQAHVPTSWADPISTLRINVEGTQNVLDGARLARVRRVIAVTSSEVYGAADVDRGAFEESAELRPKSPYGASKAAAEAVALQAYLGGGLDVIRARGFNHIGPGQSQDFVAAGLASRVARAEACGATTIAVGNLSAIRDFTDVSDVVRAYRLLAETGDAGEVYNVCSGKPIAIQELADRLMSLTDGSIEMVSDPKLHRPVEEPFRVGNPSKLQHATGWAPKIQLTESIEAILTHARKVQATDRSHHG